MTHTTLPFLLAAFSAACCFGQQAVTLNEAIQSALQHNDQVKSSALQVEYFNQIKKSSTDIGKLSASWMHGQYNSAYQDNNFTLTQSIPFPTTLASQVSLGREQVVGARQALRSAQNDLITEVKSGYYHLLYLEAMRKLLQSQDSLFTDFARASALRHKTGESNLLEKTTAEVQQMEARNQLRINQADIDIAKSQLSVLMKAEVAPVTKDTLRRREIDLEGADPLLENPRLNYLRQQTIIGERVRKVERNRVLPDINVGYFNQTLVGYQNLDGQERYYGRDKRFQGFQLGLSLPLWIGPDIAKVKASSINEASLRKNEEHFQSVLKGGYHQALQEYEKDRASLEYYENTALKNADLILVQASKAYRGGEIGYIEYLQSVKTALSIRSTYLQALDLYNQAVIKIEFLLGKS